MCANRVPNLGNPGRTALKTSTLSHAVRGSFFCSRLRHESFSAQAWWHGWAVRSRLRPMGGKAERMLKRRLENIFT